MSFFAGNLVDAPGATVRDAPDFVRSRIRAEQIYTIVRYTPATMAANVCNAVVLVVALRGTRHENAALLWAFVLCAISAFHYLKGLSMREAGRQQYVSARSITHAIAYAGVLGCLWGAAPFLFFEHVDMSAMIVIVCLCCGMLCGGAIVLASIPAAAAAFMAPVLAGSLVALMRSDVQSQLYLSTLFVSYACVLGQASVSHSRQLVMRLTKQIEAETVARQDTLTSLSNVRSFREGLERALQRVTAYGDGVAVFYLDLDGFKPINDRHGHAAGDDVLIQVANRLSATVRPNDIVARIGGDEFAIAMPGVGGAIEAVAQAERIMRAFNLPFFVAGSAQAIGVSMGIALAPADGADTATLIEKADHALYQVKATGGRLYRFFDAHHAATVRERRELELDLRNAIVNQQIHLAFQPIADVRSGRMCGCEALARWDHPTRGSIAPDQFIPMAERTGLIHEIGAWIIRDSCRVAARLPDDIVVSVNVSVAQLRGEAFIESLRAAVDEFKLTPDRIEIEITESLLIGRDDPAIEFVRRIAAAGFRIALDDFGTGYASLNYLRRLPLHRVKIDREFVQDSIAHDDCAMIVHSVIGLARSLDLLVTAEGVETEEQLAFLRAAGCGAAQGYLIAKPLAESDLMAAFAEERAREIAA